MTRKPFYGCIENLSFNFQAVISIYSKSSFTAEDGKKYQISVPKTVIYAAASDTENGSKGICVQVRLIIRIISSSMAAGTHCVRLDQP